MDIGEPFLTKHRGKRTSFMAKEFVPGALTCPFHSQAELRQASAHSRNGPFELGEKRKLRHNKLSRTETSVLSPLPAVFYRAHSAISSQSG
jgi:hypothetical protein